MPSLQRNLIANTFGQGWVALMGIAFVPLYIRLLGIEAYGLIGVFAVLQAWLTLLDLGLALALNREMARFTAGVHTAQGVRDLLRSVEAVALTLGVTAAVLVSACAPWLASHWVNASTLDARDVEQALHLMGLVVACRVLEGVFHGAMLGLQHQVRLSVAAALLATFRWGGAGLALLWGHASVQVFFGWQALASVLAVLVFAVLLYRELPPGASGRFQAAALRAMWPFASGVIATTLLGLMITQLDKLVLSRVLSLEDFGYYALAAFLASAIQQLIVPIAQAYYPRLTQLVAAGDAATLARTYHEAAQLVSVVVVPAALLLIFFGEAALRLWTGNTGLAQATAPLLALLAAGSLLNGFMSIPYNLQLAHGWSQLSARFNMVAVLFFVPALVCVAPRHGGIGVAWLWVGLNAAYATIGIHLMHRRLLPREKWAWYGRDVVGPLAAGGAVAGAAVWLRPAPSGTFAEAAWIVFAGLAALLAAGAAAPLVRVRFLRRGP
jgi:O-antigen/teichoic acid export membrane protein